MGSEKYPQDALDYVGALWALPSAGSQPQPERGALVKLLKLVEFHPLSISLLVRQLQERRIAAVGQRLAQLLMEVPATAEEGANPLVASLLLSLDRLDAGVKRWLPRLGVFAGGAFEDDLQAILEIEAADWRPIRGQLEATGLIQAEVLPNIASPFLKFHPTLAPVLWAQLGEMEQTELRNRHAQRYYLVSYWLYTEDDKNPLATRAIARRELPNLMQAVNRAIATTDSDASQFVTCVNRFLIICGFGQDRAALTKQMEQLNEEVGSHTWFLKLTNQGEALRAAEQVMPARAIFEQVLAGLGKMPSYARCNTLRRIGQCLVAQGQTAQAVERYRAAIVESERLEPSDGLKRQRGTLHADLGDVLTDMGEFAAARLAYETAGELVREVGDDRSEVVIEFQLGTLAMLQHDLQDAATRYQRALQAFRQLNEPEMEAKAWHQLGNVYCMAKDWEAAEHRYREAAALFEAQGNLAGAAKTLHQLAVVIEGAGRVEAAAAWYEKAIEAFQKVRDFGHLSKTLNNLANLLQSQPNPSPDDLATARQHAETALEIMQTLDPAAAQIWKNYSLLGVIAEKQGRQPEARAYRQQARQAKANYAGTQHELKRFAPLIAGVVQAVDDAEAREQLLPTLEDMAQRGWTHLIAAIRQILNGERDAATLWDSLDMEDSMIIQTILQGIADPATLQPLLDDPR
ncbi:MAG: tetratricopeptide repeat protein [Geitlerinemataceae cyanobacterium]